MALALTLILAFVLSVVLTRAYLAWAEVRDIGADENHRTMHAGRVPTGGGLPLLVAALIVTLAIWPPVDEYRLLLPALVALAVVSWIDDVKAVPPPLRLFVHVGATLAALAAIPADRLVFQGALPLLLDRAVGGLALVWFINLYNFMDGIDGIAGVETVGITLGYAAVLLVLGQFADPLMPLALAVAGATLGFLVWNWQPARIFMGDVGAVPLGFLTGWLMLDLATRISLAAALILPLYFAADATITLARRVLRGEKPWEPHREHAYQRAARALGSHAAVSARVAECNGALILCALLALVSPWTALLLAAGAVGLLFTTLAQAERGRPVIRSSSR